MDKEPEPTYKEKLADMLAFYRKQRDKGYNPETERTRSEIRDLKDQVKRLQGQISDLEESHRRLNQRFEAELKYISVNLAEYAEQAAIYALKKTTERR